MHLILLIHKQLFINKYFTLYELYIIRIIYLISYKKVIQDY